MDLLRAWVVPAAGELREGGGEPNHVQQRVPLVRDHRLAQAEVPGRGIYKKMYYYPSPHPHRCWIINKPHPTPQKY